MPKKLHFVVVDFTMILATAVYSKSVIKLKFEAATHQNKKLYLNLCSPSGMENQFSHSRKLCSSKIVTGETAIFIFNLIFQ
jgi:hypothetical protein